MAVVLAVAVPGFLVTACSGQAGGSPDRAASIASRASAARAAPGASRARRPSSVLAVHLLSQSAQAAVQTSYQGQEIVFRWGTNGPSFLESDIWHVSGGQTVTRTLSAGIYSSGQPYLSSDTDGQWPEGVLGVTMPLVRLLEAHYIVVYG